MNDPGSKALLIFISLVKSICTNNATIFILDFLNKFWFNLLIQQCISLPGLDKLENAVFNLVPFSFNSSWSCGCLSWLIVPLLIKRLILISYLRLSTLSRIFALWTVSKIHILRLMGNTFDRCDSLDRANHLLEVSYSGVEGSLCLAKLSILIRWSLVCRLNSSMDASLEWLWCDLSDHDFVCFIFLNLIRLTANNWWWNNQTWLWISKSYNLAERRKLESKWESIKHLLNTHILRD